MPEAKSYPPAAADPTLAHVSNLGDLAGVRPSRDLLLPFVEIEAVLQDI